MAMFCIPPPSQRRSFSPSVFREITSSRLSSKTLDVENSVSRFRSKSVSLVFSGALALGLSLSGIAEAKVGVNKPELLPEEFTTVIDVAGFLSNGQEKRMAKEISDIEQDTGFKLRVLAQNYPVTPGLAIKDFWQVDDSTIVFVADPTFGNILNFNVGATVDLDIPRSFWSRLAGKYGNMFYWKEKGEDASIEAAVMAISSCLREPVGSNNCSEINVYVGNIHTQVTEPLLQEVFASTGPIERCKLIRKDKSSYGFVHYFDRRSAGLAFLSLNGRHLFGQPIKVNWAYASGQREDTSGHFNIFVGDLSPEVTHSYLGGRQMKCSWGSKPTPAGTASNPLPPPGPAPIPGFSASDLLAYERQLAMSKMAGMNPLMHHPHPQGQHAMKQAAMGATGSSQGIYDGGFQNAQQLMYYQ